MNPSALLAALDDVARAWSGFMVAQGIAALVALAAVLLLRVAMRAASPHFHGALLLLALAPLALPMPRLPIAPPWTSSLQEMVAPQDEVTIVLTREGAAAAPALPSDTTTPSSIRTSGAHAPASSGLGENARTLAFTGWLAIVALLLVRWFRRELRLRRLLRGAREVAPSELGLGDLELRGGVLRRANKVRVIESDALASPATIGLLRPTIVLPLTLRATLQPAELRFVLLHELAHVRRGDLLVGALERLLRIVWFFHPTAWIAGRLLESEREAACDDAALSAFHRRERRACADAFLKVVELARGAPPLVGAAAMSRDGRDARRRLLRMVEPGRPIAQRLSKPGWVAVAACAAGLLLLLQPRPGLAATGGAPAPKAGDPADDSELGGAITRGVEWLLAHQDPDGHWDADGFAAQCKGGAGGEVVRCDGGGDPKHDVGVSGLALLALHRTRKQVDAGHATRVESALARGSQWLARSQDRDGCIGGPIGQHFIYGHVYGVLALAELQAADPRPERAAAIESALRYLVKARNPYSAWRYSGRPDGDNDASVTGTVELVFGRALDAGFPIDSGSITDGFAFLDKMTDPATGRTGYQTRGSRPARTMDAVAKWPAETSESLTALVLHARASHDMKLGADEDSRRALALLTALPPSWDDPARIDFYYWFHASAALRAVGGAPWLEWRKAALAALLPHQRRDGDAAGSFDPVVDPWGREGGRVYATAVNLLTFAVAADA